MSILNALPCRLVSTIVVKASNHWTFQAVPTSRVAWPASVALQRGGCGRGIVQFEQFTPIKRVLTLPELANDRETTKKIANRAFMVVLY